MDPAAAADRHPGRGGFLSRLIGNRSGSILDIPMRRAPGAE